MSQETIGAKQQATIQATDDTALQAVKPAQYCKSIIAADAWGVWGTTCSMSGLATNGIGDIVTEMHDDCHH